MVELHLQAALGTKSPDSPLQIDESILYASPGKIVDAFSHSTLFFEYRQNKCSMDQINIKNWN